MEHLYTIAKSRAVLCKNAGSGEVKKVTDLLTGIDRSEDNFVSHHHIVAVGTKLREKAIFTDETKTQLCVKAFNVRITL